MKQPLPEFAKGRVIVFGDLMLDRYWYGQSNRISPEAPVPVVRVADGKELPGGAGNVALNLSALGSQTKLFAVIGEDEAGERLQQILHQAHIDVVLHRIEGMPTTTKLRLLSANQQIVRMDFEQPSQNLEIETLQAECEQALTHADVLILSDYNKGCILDPQPLIQAAKRSGVKTMVDPKQLDFSIYRDVSVVTPNFNEFTSVVGECQDDAMILEKGLNLARTHNIDALLVTRGEHGMTLIEQSGQHFTIPAKAPEVYDVTGAGDTVVAVMAAALAANADLSAAVRLANTAAGIVVGQLGATSVNTTQLQTAVDAEYITAHPPHAIKTITFAELDEVLDTVTSENERIVFFIDTFDVIRAHDLERLERLKAEYDRVVAVVQAESEIALGHSLPARCAAIAGFSDVDWVLSANDEACEALAQKVKPLNGFVIARKNIENTV